MAMSEAKVTTLADTGLFMGYGELMSTHAVQRVRSRLVKTSPLVLLSDGILLRTLTEALLSEKV